MTRVDWLRLLAFYALMAAVLVPWLRVLHVLCEMCGVAR